MGWLVTAGLVLPSSALAEGQGIDQVLTPIRAQAAAIADAVEGRELPAWLQPAPGGAESFNSDGRDLLAAARAQLQSPGLQAQVCQTLEADCDRLLPGAAPEASGAEAASSGTTFLFFVSRSLGNAQLRELFELATGRPGIHILFRGVDEGESLIAFVASLRPLLDGLDPTPNVLLDPAPFRSYGIEAVPTLVALGPDGTELARVAGLAGTDWLASAIGDGRSGNLGTRGPVTAIQESDLLTEIERRLAALDLPAMKARALDRAFGRLRFEPLPVATEDRTRWVDPTLFAAADIRTPNGALLAAAGDAVNPLEQVPFTQRLVVFDAGDARQLAFAVERTEDASAKASDFLLTGLPRDQRWNGLEQVMTRLQRRVYLLTPALRHRFGLERVPAVVEAEGLRFQVTETAMRGPASPESVVARGGNGEPAGEGDE